MIKNSHEELPGALLHGNIQEPAVINRKRTLVGHYVPSNWKRSRESARVRLLVCHLGLAHGDIMCNWHQMTLDIFGMFTNRLPASLKPVPWILGITKLTLKSLLTRDLFANRYEIGIETLYHGAQLILLANQVDLPGVQPANRVTTVSSTTHASFNATILVATAESFSATAFRFCNTRLNSLCTFSGTTTLA